MQSKEDDKTRWDAKYHAGSHSDSEPDDFLVSAFQKFLSDQRPGRALDLAGGAGRNALWLAARGWRVTLLDVSDAAVQIAEERARELQTGGLIAVRHDVSTHPDLGNERFDLVLVFYFLDRQLFPSVIRTLKPGGFVVYRTYTVDQRKFGRGPSDPTFLLEPNELREAFQNLQILHYRESVTDKATAELVARRPSSGNPETK